MKPRINDIDVQAVKGVALTDIVGKYVNLKRYGARFRGLCPFHSERTPSFYVHPTKGYKCFGCDTGGSNAVDFIMKIEKASFVQAVEFVAREAGITIGS